MIRFDNTYARLPQRFFQSQRPAAVSAPKLIQLNTQLARLLGLDPVALGSPEGIQILAGNNIAAGSEPVAMAYAGHQFGNFVPQLGDGRAILLGELIATDGHRRDIQLKGAGPTQFSRRGDGRLALGPALREYLISEAFAALAIPTTRSLAVVASGDTVVRETHLPGAVLTRVAASHVRVGTFQYFAARADTDGVKALADYVIARHYPDAAAAVNPYAALLDAVIERQARLIAQWQLTGFIHGVMNTDNMAISGETIDYGPCAFMDAYDPAQVYSYIDQMGRYSYGNQPYIAQWNLARFAETLVPFLADGKEAGLQHAQAAIGGFPTVFEASYTTGLRRKLGLSSDASGDHALGQDLLHAMAASKADFTLTFRRLCDVTPDPVSEIALRQLFTDQAAIAAWLQKWRLRAAQDSGDPAARRQMMRSANPAFIPRNHRVEEALLAAVADGDLGPFRTLLTVLAHPFEDQLDHHHLADPPRPEQIVEHTFCGT
ncbi:MAG: protein adenylyltransferase SelO [Hyphomicrobiaceae bacterium]